MYSNSKYPVYNFLDGKYYTSKRFKTYLFEFIWTNKLSINCFAGGIGSVESRKWKK